MREPCASIGSVYNICRALTSSSLASAAVFPASIAAANALPIPYEVSIPHDLADKIACLCAVGMSTVFKILLTTLLVLPGIIAKSTTQVGP